MKIIEVKTQAEFDALPASFAEYTQIQIMSEKGNLLVVNKARENSSVEAWGNSSVEARGNSSVEAWENSSVVARGNSSVEAWENSSVVAWENSSVEAWGNCGVHAFSIDVHITLWAYAVVWLIKKAKVFKKSKTSVVITPKTNPGTNGWLDGQGVKNAPKIILYKKVSYEFKTQEKEKNETLWPIGEVVEHKAWEPKKEECGDGKFHAVSRPYFADEFRSVVGDRYIALEIYKKDLYAWPNPGYPHKIAFRKCKVLYECNKFGKKRIGD